MVVGLGGSVANAFAPGATVVTTSGKLKRTGKIMAGIASGCPIAPLSWV